MYNVSDKYKAAMKRPVQRFRLTGKIGGIDFTDKDILKDSMSLTNQCSGSENVQIGQVYTAELNITFMRSLGLQRYSLKGLEIVPKHGLLLEDGTYEDVPLGVYSISEANWTESGLVVKAYDNMSKLDKSCSVSSTNGTLFELASLACESCGLELAQTEEEFAAMPNGEETFFLYSENDIETWRDFISWVAQTAGAFVTADREGKIVFRQYGTEVVDTIDKYHRLSGASFSDFHTRYTGLSCVNIYDKTTSYYALEKDDGLTYNLGSNPFLQSFINSSTGSLIGDAINAIKENTRKRRAVLDAIAVIDYVPFNVSMIGSPAYDLGDILQFTDGIGDSDALCCITKFDFKYNNQYSCEGVGSNPALSDAKSKTDKDISGLEGQVASKSISVNRYINAQKYALGSTNTSIMLLRFTSVNACMCLFSATILIDVSADSVSLSGTDASGNAITVTSDGKAILTLTYAYNNEKIKDHVPIEALSSGKHIVTIHKAFSADEDTVNRLELLANITGGSADIDVGWIEATVLGQGLSTSAAVWDGNIEVEETYTPLIINSKDLTIGSIAESISAKTDTPTSSTITEVFAGIAINDDLTIGSMFDEIISRFVITASSINAENAEECTFDRQYVACDTAFKLVTNYEYSAVEQTIDSGRMEILDIDFAQFASVSDVTLSGYTPESNTLYLYKEGDECTDITGGWAGEGTKNEDNLYPYWNNYSYTLYTNGKIDFTNYKTLYIDIDVLSVYTVSGYEPFGAILYIAGKQAMNSNINGSLDPTIVTRKECNTIGRQVYSLDVSDVSGEYYVSLLENLNQNCRAKFYNMWLVK